jgi:hypothetical protein
MNRSYMIGIIIRKSDADVTGAAKYHDIMNVESKIITFLRFAHQAFPDAEYVNFYFKATNKAEKGRNFAFRRYISEVS